MKGPISEDYLLHVGKAKDLSSILSLDLSKHDLTSLDASLFNKLTSLKSLDISQNQLSSIPDLLSLPKLRVLDICDNHLQTVDFVERFTNLHELYIDGNSGIKKDDVYIAKILCRTLSRIDGIERMDHINTVIKCYTSQLQLQICAVWEAKFAEVYSDSISQEEIGSLHTELVDTINKSDIVGSNISMDKLRKFMIDNLSWNLLYSVNKGSYKTADHRCSTSPFAKRDQSTPPPRHSTRIASGTMSLKDYSSGAPVQLDNSGTKKMKLLKDINNSAEKRRGKRKRNDSESESPVGKRQKTVDCDDVEMCSPDISAVDAPRQSLPPLDDYEPSLFLRCHAKGNNPADGQTKVWKCAFEPSTNENVSHVVATCGGKLVCFIDCQTGKVLKRYKDNSKSESFYALAWTTFKGDGQLLKDDINILAVAGEDGEIKLIHPRQLVMFGKLLGHRNYVSSLVFHPHNPHILFSGSRDNKIIMWEIDTPNFTNMSVTWRQKSVLSLPKTDAVTMVISPSHDLLIAGCERSCYAWNISSLKQGHSHKSAHYEFLDPTDGETEATIDGLVLLPNDCIMMKCVGSSQLYVWDIGRHIGGVRKGSSMKRIPIRPLAYLDYMAVDVDYLYPGATQGVVYIGDDKGNVHLYNLTDVLEKKKTTTDKVMTPSMVLPYPDIEIDSRYKNIMEEVSLSKSVVINCVAMSDDRDYMVCGTDNNLVCIWRKSTLQS